MDLQFCHEGEPAVDGRLNWNDLKVVLALAREGSVQGAARGLGVNETTITRRLAEIEAALGSRVFDRAERGRYPPTEQGEILIGHAARIEQRILDMQNEVAGRDTLAAGQVRLTCVPVLVNHVLTAHCSGLLARYPDLRLEFISDFRNLDLTKREAEIAVRLGGPDRRTGDSLLTRRIGILSYAEYAPADREGPLPWITYDSLMGRIPQARWIAERAASDGSPISPIAFNDAEGIRQAVRRGLGRSILPCVVADGDSLLRRIGAPSHTREVWLLTHPDQRSLARVDVVVDWLSDLFQRLSSV